MSILVKNRLTDSEIVSIIDALHKADRKRHRRSYRGRVTAIEISNEELVKQHDNETILLEDSDSEYVYTEGFEWVRDFFADKHDIETALAE